MPYEVRVERAGPRVLAAVSAVTRLDRLSADIPRLLDQVWPLLREQGARTGHNVVIYHPSEAGEFTIDAWVEVFSGVTESGPVRRVETPAGEVAVTAHFGEYAALDQWYAASGRHSAGVNWEVYGDWDENPARLRTDVYTLILPA